MIKNIKPIDLGLNINLPTFQGKSNVSPRQIKAGSSFDTTSSFKGMLSPAKGTANVNISKEDIEKLKKGFQRFTSGGEALGKRLRKGGSREKLSRGPLQNVNVRNKLAQEKELLEKRLQEIKMPVRSKATPVQSVLANIKSRFGLR